MLPISSYNRQELKAVQKACAYLFPPQKIFNHGFLKAINEFTLKQAYLRQIRYCHPAAAEADTPAVRKKKLDHLQMARQCYDFLLQRISIGAFDNAPPLPGRIIAVGGAKGGVGKSMFAANLCVFLAQRGYKTVAADLDLGGANLTLYLGDKYILDRTVNDFLSKKYDSLSDIMIQSRYGPLMIGGDSSDLGAANIPHAKKMKLMRAIRGLEADFIVLDLGGDTSYNMLDFFLLGDYGIVITTRDSASYIGAYQFLKTALFRKLNRLSGPEAEEDKISDPLLAQVVKDATQSAGGPVAQSINELLERVAAFDPLDLPLVLNPIIDFNPYLVVNRVNSAMQAQQVVQTISSLSRKTLSVHIDSPGTIRKFPEIEDNLRNLAPLVAQAPNGRMAEDLAAIVKNIGIGR